jgi:hypothetical protein
MTAASWSADEACCRRVTADRRLGSPGPQLDGPGPQPGNPGVISVLCVHSVQNVRESGRNGRDGRSGCCRGCCHGPGAPVLSRWCRDHLRRYRPCCGSESSPSVAHARRRDRSSDQGPHIRHPGLKSAVYMPVDGGALLRHESALHEPMDGAVIREATGVGDADRRRITRRHGPGVGAMTVVGGQCVRHAVEELDALDRSGGTQAALERKWW